MPNIRSDAIDDEVLPRLRAVVGARLAQAGQPPDLARYRRIVACRALGRRIASAYLAAPRLAAVAVPSYLALAEATRRQFDWLTVPAAKGGLGISVSVVPDDPYPGPPELQADLKHGVLRVWSTTACGNRHPLLSDDDNDQFRAVHDALGHALGRGFDVHGEEAVWLLQHRLYPRAARAALATELRGQTSTLVFGPQAGFAAQKAVLLPAALRDPVTVHRAPCGGGCGA